MTPLTDEEKRTIASRYRALRTAIDEGQAEDDVMRLAAAFQQAYRGDSRPIVDAIGEADDLPAFRATVSNSAFLSPRWGTRKVTLLPRSPLSHSSSSAVSAGNSGTRTSRGTASLSP